MDKLQQLKHLQYIKDNYFFQKDDGYIINHYSDCAYYQAGDIYGIQPCNCGLLYFLDKFYGPDLLYINFYKEQSDSSIIWRYNHEQSIFEKPIPISTEIVDKLLKEIFGKLEKPPVDISELEFELLDLIEEIFGKEFRTARQNEYQQYLVNREKEWMTKNPI